MQRHRPFAIFLILFFSFPGYVLAGNDPVLSGLIPIAIPGGAVIQAELANTPQKRAEGLMYRTYLAPDRGMLFTFSQAEAWVFWMKNTKIPLDLIWMDQNRLITEIVPNAQPCKSDSAATCPKFGGNRRSVFVLELNAGMAAKHGLKPGDRLDF